MLFRDFSARLQQLEKTSSRLEMMYQLAEVFGQLDSIEIKPTCYLLQGQLLPSYEAMEFGVAVKTLIKAIAGVTPTASTSEPATDLFGQLGETTQQDRISQAYKQLGDLGTVIEAELSEVTPTVQLTITEVYDLLVVIAQEAGTGSQEKKLQGLITLFSKVDALSAKFVVRMILGKLRLGFSTMTMLDALSWAMTKTKNETSSLEDAYQRRADIGFLAATYLGIPDQTQRQAALAAITVEVGTPVVPALCQRLNSAQEIIEKMGQVMAEPKYDGLRIQIHIDKQAAQPLKTFTRNLENNSEMFPELLTVIDQLKCQSCILDAEGIGYDKATGKLLPFQDTITRKRKHDISATAAEIPIRAYVFDVLAIDGKSFINEPLRVRKDVLKDLFQDNEVMIHSPVIETDDPKVLRTFHEAKLAEGLEGAVIKQVDEVYQSGRKGWSWVKIKEAEGARGKLKDTLDCVVMGYYVGRGKRTAFGVGAFLVGVLDQNQQLKTIAKIGTGLSDEQFRELKDRCQLLVVDQSPSFFDVPKALVPDVWVKPGIVVEIAADELTKSPQHTAGLALRFPRLVRFRDDKSWEQATTTSELSALA
jgi:DNA ligase-1